MRKSPLFFIGISLLSICILSFFGSRFFCTAFPEPLAPKGLIHGKVLICGVCKDVGKALSHTRTNVETMGALFEDYKVLIYENNSRDRTVKLLKAWEKANPKVSITTETVDDELLSSSCFNKTVQGDFYRPERIARARNIVLDQAMDPKYDDFAYVIWVDLDFKHPFPFDEIVKTFQSEIEWHAVFSNGISDKGNLYDSWALRDADLPLGAEFIGNQWWTIRGQKVIRLSNGDPWYPVFSAFGGLGIYKREAIKGCRYSAVVTEDVEKLGAKIIAERMGTNHPEIDLYLNEISTLRSIIHLPHLTKDLPYYKNQREDLPGGCDGFTIGNTEHTLIFRMNSGVCQYPCICEHVPFHASMILNGHDKLYINPNLVLCYFNRS